MSTRTGPQYYPGANRTSYWHEDKYPGTAMEVNVACLHTTEGTSVPTYGGGGSAPNFTALPDFKNKRLRWYQHFRVDSSARALANRYGGVETNTLNVVQAELVGTCDPSTSKRWAEAGREHIFWPQAPAWALEDVADFLAWLHEEHGVPLSGPSEWPAYPSSYANGSGQRMSASAWNGFKGVCGHMHVPENNHGDPGSINFSGLLTLAKKMVGDDEDDEPTPTRPSNPKPAPKPQVPAFPGRKYFRLGVSSKHTTQLGAQLKKKGFARFHDGDGFQPGPRFTDYDRKNVQAFQRSDRRLRGDADGYPGPLTWKLLFS